MPNAHQRFDAWHAGEPRIHFNSESRMSSVSKSEMIRILLVCSLAAPVAGVALWSIGHTARDLLNPCTTWGYPLDQPVSVRLGPHDICRARSVHVESKAGATLQAAIVPGGMLIASLLAVTGVFRSRRRMMIAAGIGLLAETLVAFTISPLTLIAGAGFLLVATRVSAGSA